MLFAVEAQGPKPAELIIVRAVEAFQIGIFFVMSIVVLDQATSNSKNQLTQVSDLHSRFSPNSSPLSTVNTGSRTHMASNPPVVGLQPILSIVL